MRHRILAGVTAVALAAGLSACESLTSINQDPNGPLAVSPPALLSDVIQATAGGETYNSGVGGVGMMNVRGAGLWVQYYSEIQYRDEDRYHLRPGTDGNWYLYSGPLENVQRMINEGTAADEPNWDAVGRIMKSYLFSVMTDAMGDIPYSEALKGVSPTEASGGDLQPKYDTQQDIYDGMLADLATAAGEFTDDPLKAGFPTGDIMYGGDLAEWELFANSLRLRLAMHLTNVEPQIAEQQAAAAVAAGVFESNDDNAQVMFLASPPDRNPIFVDAISRDDYGMSKTYVDSLKSWNDPRLPVFAQPNTADTIGTTYQGLQNGLLNSAGPALNTISRIGAMWRETAAAPIALLTYSEVLFLEAEAAQRGWISGDAATFYEDAIRASMEEYGVASADIDAYLAQPRVQYNAATGLEQIAYQKWASMFMQGMEAWTEYRRTLVPTLVAGPNADFNSIPERLPYADDELVLNKANIDAAMASQGFSGSTDLQTPLWFTGRQ